MRASGRKKILSVILSLMVVASLAIALVPGTASAAVTVQAVPRMVSIWGLGLFPDPGFSTGPDHSTLIVTAPAPPAAAPTLDFRAVFNKLFPTAASRVTLFPSAVQSAYNARMTAWSAIPFTWDAGIGAWRHDLGAEMPFTAPNAMLKAVAGSVLFQEAVLGDVTVPIKVGATTYTTKVSIVDMQRPLQPGWNGVSTPAYLGINRWASIAALGDGLDADAAVKWDPTSQTWKNVSASNTVNPVEVVYVHATRFTAMGFVFSRSSMPPASYHVHSNPAKGGFNLVGAAVVRGKTSGGADSYFEMPVDQLMSSISGVYTAVLSPGQSFAYTQTFKDAGGDDIDTYDWSFNQASWVYAAGAASAPQATVGGAYWVNVNASDTLVGFSQTPVDVIEWDPFP
ncbi:MAG: hypothetical protein Q7T05_06505 [Dehalococcoidia bacterium]|nr:hypothetical protein [Dehalococcoidia bacterium]